MSFKTLYFSARNAPECRKMHLNSQISQGEHAPEPPLAYSLALLSRSLASLSRFGATKDEFGPLK